MWFTFTLVSGFMADRIGRKKIYLIGFACLALTGRVPARIGPVRSAVGIQAL